MHSMVEVATKVGRNREMETNSLGAWDKDYPKHRLVEVCSGLQQISRDLVLLPRAFLPPWLRDHALSIVLIQGHHRQVTRTCCKG